MPNANGTSAIFIIAPKGFEENATRSRATATPQYARACFFPSSGQKTHSKALLVVRRREGRVQRYAHLADESLREAAATVATVIDLGSACENGEEEDRRTIPVP